MVHAALLINRIFLLRLIILRSLSSFGGSIIFTKQQYAIPLLIVSVRTNIVTKYMSGRVCVCVCVCISCKSLFNIYKGLDDMTVPLLDEMETMEETV